MVFILMSSFAVFLRISGKITHIRINNNCDIKNCNRDK